MQASIYAYFGAVAV